MDSADALRAQAHDAYWHSDETVDQVANRLGISRNALYSAIQPFDAATPCPRCEASLVFTNRSSRSASRATCVACETEILIAGPVIPADATAVRNGPAAEAFRGEPRSGRLGQFRNDLAAVEPERVALIGGAAALGVALGAAAVRIVRDR